MRRAGLGALLAGLAALAGTIAIVAHAASHRRVAGLEATRPKVKARARSAGAEAAVSPSCVPAQLNVSAALAGERVTVSPAPDTRDASAATQISMLGVPAGELADVSVSGSRSGVHAGRLEAYSQGDGASFVPVKPFDAGELVTVHAAVREGTGTIPFAWSFTVATIDERQSASAARVTAARTTVARAGSTGSASTAAAATPRPAPKEYQSFHSRPQLRPPDITVAANADTASGDMFLAPYSGVGQYGPMILDEHGNLLWFKALPPGTRAADLRVQSYEGKPVLTWWQDPLVAGGSSTAGVVIANSAYQNIAVVRAGNGYQPDLHEFQITPQNTALITVYDAIDCNLQSIGGPRNGAVADTLLQEIDLKTGLVMYEWHSLDHVPLSNSYASPKPSSRREPYDYFHINSIDVEHDGDLLVDSRNTWAAYDVNAKTGQVRWELGGKRSSYKLGPGAATAWQHDARQQADGAITFFDNGATPQVHTQSRAVELTLDQSTMTATLTRSYEHKNPLVAGSQGNVQVLENGDWMIGWGQAGYLSEIGPANQLLFNAHLPPEWESYRTYIFPWNGRPSVPPAVAVVPAANSLVASGPGGGVGGGSSGGVGGVTGGGAASAATVYASWNGATEVASWRLLAGASAGSLAPVATVARSGFETAIALPSSAPSAYVQVQALNAAGAVIGTSAATAG